MYTATSKQYWQQLCGAEVQLGKIKAAIIMQAWIDGYYVTEYHDTLLLEKEEPCP